MKKYGKALVNIAVAVTMFLAAAFLLPRVLIFFSPFVVGWVIALIASPLVRFFEEKFRLKRKIGSAFVIVAVIALVVLLVYFAGALIVEQVMGLLRDLPEMWKGMQEDLNDIADTISSFAGKFFGNNDFRFSDMADQLGVYLGNFFGSLGTPTLEAAGNLAKRLPTIFIGLIMALLSSYFFVAERSRINQWFIQHTSANLQLRYRMICNCLTQSVGGYFKAQLKIEVWMYLLLLLGLGLLRVRYFALIALGIAILDLLPFLGTGTVLIPWALIKLLTANYKMALWLLIIWCGGQLARQLIQPKIVGDSIGVAPLPTLFLLFGGYKLGGILGMIMAVPLGLLVYTMYQEGAFDTTKKSVQILLAGLNHFRRIEKEDLLEVEEMEKRNAEAFEELNEQRQEAIRKKSEEAAAGRAGKRWKIKK
ncbi:MAG: sporulation integral membrane protein YtvI [Acetatifactor sp.]